MAVSPNSSSDQVMAEQIAARIAQVRSELPPTVKLIAVTKKQPIAAIRAAYDAGVRDFGESLVPEAIAKQAELQDLTNLTWHLIGHLQSNKARKALEHFQWIHSIDSLKLAKRLDQLAEEMGKSPYCCLQVKMVSDPPKYGFELAELSDSLPQLDQLSHLQMVGLMTIPPLHTPPAETRQIFQQAADLSTNINQRGWQRIHIQQLSMGMSGDYPLAIASGATMVRLGTTLFGQRSQSSPL